MRKSKFQNKRAKNSPTETFEGRRTRGKMKRDQRNKQAHRAAGLPIGTCSLKIGSIIFEETLNFLRKVQKLCKESQKKQQKTSNPIHFHHTFLISNITKL